MELRVRVDAAGEEERRLSHLVAPLVARQQQQKQKEGELNQLLHHKVSEVGEITKKIRSLQEAMDQFSDKVDEEHQAVVMSRAEAEDRDKRISAAQRILDGWQDELRTLCTEDAAEAAAAGDGGREVPTTTGTTTPSSSWLTFEARRLTEELQALGALTAERSAERAQLSSRLRGAEDDLRRLECDARRVQDAVGQRADRLSRRSPHSAEASRWLAANRHRFRGLVHEPIALMLTPRDDLAARYLENHISANDLRAFVFETREDMETFLRVMRDEQKLKVNAVRAPARKSEDFRPQIPLSQLSRPPYGFSSYLRELFDAPALVMSFLCEQYHVHDVPVGTETTTENLEKVLSDLPLREFYTTMSQYRMRKSRYTGDLLTTSSGLRPPQLLIASSVASEELTAVNSKREEVTREAATLRDDIAALTDTMRDLAVRDNLLCGCDDDDDGDDGDGGDGGDDGDDTGSDT
ncbi:structural maintenance of chromosomes protein 5-like [Petromyzon marinus]|uniref:structural maintenance of chromosomes protein 5-like n=1 Tax=Petromyzon marinus TaxID=7757 RepID=UPI003F6F5B38